MALIFQGALLQEAEISFLNHEMEANKFLPSSCLTALRPNTDKFNHLQASYILQCQFPTEAGIVAFWMNKFIQIHT